jgi:rare lipoprotein A
MHGLTAAHLSLPFDTVVRVTNTANGRSVDVRINDRGPFRKERILDVSRAAAERLGIIATGTAKVRVEVIAPPGMVKGPTWTPAATSPPRQNADPACGESSLAVQVGAFRDPANAARTLAELSERYSQARIVPPAPPAGTLHRVMVAAPDAAGAKRTLEQLNAEGIPGFIVSLESNSPCLPTDAS